MGTRPRPGAAAHQDAPPPRYLFLALTRNHRGRHYLPEHEQQLAKLDDLITQRQAAFRARTGEEMSASNVWLEQRLTEKRALQKITTVLGQPELVEHPDQPVRGPGTAARATNQAADVKTR